MGVVHWAVVALVLTYVVMSRACVLVLVFAR